VDERDLPWWAQPATAPTDGEATAAPSPGEPLAAPVEHRHRGLNRVTALLAALLVLVSGISGGALAAVLHHPTASSPSAQSGQPAPGNGFGFHHWWQYGGNAGPGGTNAGSGGTNSPTGPVDAASIGRRVAPGIVDINTWIGYQQAQAAGTGMVLTPGGEILTNNHVITGATKITATDVGNGKTYAATVVGYDRSHDVAVLQLAGASGLQTVRTGNSSAVRVGQAVVAVGNAGGTGGEPSYAGGSVTALDQTITASNESDGTSEQLTGLIETNADVVPGDSGGPLVDQSGRVIGMDTAASDGFRFSATGGDGYAIPIDDALRIAHQISSGNASSTVHIGPTALLGVEVQAAQDQNGFGAPTSGALVAGVVSGGPAEAAGIVAGDLITAVDGQPVDSPDALSAAMLAQRPGDVVSVGYVDGSGRQRSVQVRLGSGPPQ